MAKNTNIELTVEAWADIVINNWLSKVDAMKINDTYSLSNSFIHHIISNAGGNIQRIEFAFNYYGKFVDMGVGKGVTLEDAGITETRRKPRLWYSPTFYAEFKKLVQILAEKYGIKGQMAIVENIDDNALKWEKSWKYL
jgi:hypothetical protein